jgi:XTP/dITP diphosphohydrolase
MRLSRVVIASKNPHKIAEIRDVLSQTGLNVALVDDVDWPDVDETADTLEGNALLKAREVRRQTGLAVIADDTGLEVAALDDAPGVYSARYAGENATYADNVAKLLETMDGVADRTARFRTVVAVIDDDGEEVVVEGVLEGSITAEPRGASGFGYDPVFLVGRRTYAEMSAADKNLVSHRARALRALAAALTEPG